MDMGQSPDTDIPGAYQQSSVPLSINPADTQAVQQAMLSAATQQYPADPRTAPMDPQVTIQLLLKLLAQQTAATGAAEGAPQGIQPTQMGQDQQMPVPGQAGGIASPMQAMQATQLAGKQY